MFHRQEKTRDKGKKQLGICFILMSSHMRNLSTSLLLLHGGTGHVGSRVLGANLVCLAIIYAFRCYGVDHQTNNERELTNLLFYG